MRLKNDVLVNVTAWIPGAAGGTGVCSVSYLLGYLCLLLLWPSITLAVTGILVLSLVGLL